MKSRFILCAMMLAAASVSRAAFTPIAIENSSYNADVIVESDATPRLTILTTASIDAGTNNINATLFEKGLDLIHYTNGLPVAGSTFTSYDNANYSYQMAPSYVGPNGLLIDSTITTGAFKPVTPHAYTTLSFIGLGGNGGNTMNCTVYHQDGTSESHAVATADWFGGTTGIALIMGGRISQANNLNPEVDGLSGDGLGNPRVYHREITLTDTTSPVTNIVLTYTGGNNGAHSDIMAVSGATTVGGPVTPIVVTGYDYDFVVEASAPQNGRVLSQTIVDGTNSWATDQSLDGTNDTGAAWYEQGYNLNNDASGTANSPLSDCTGTGLPHPGSFVTNATADHIFQMPPNYKVANAIYISSAITNDTITLTTPAAFSGLSFMGAAGNGPVNVNVVINHTGGTSETNVLSVPDWFDGSSPIAYVANGRVAVDTAQFENVKSGYPLLHSIDLVLADSVNPITSIYLENTNSDSGRFSILAISGSVGALPPVITQQPASVKDYVAATATFTSSATANATITYQWQKGTNGVYVDMTDGNNISGSLTTTLTINPIGFTDQANYRMVATDEAGSASSVAATLSVFSTDTDVTQPSDSIHSFGGSEFGDSPAVDAIDNDLSTKLGMNLTSGAPYPSGVVVTPQAGLTLVTALRIYTANDTTDRDPTDYELEGSTDSGNSYTLISSNSLALPDGRNTSGAPDPIAAYDQEVRFNNINSYTTYRLTFHNYKGGNGYSQMQIGEIELIGTSVQGFYFYSQPTDSKVFNQSSAYFSAYATSPTTTPTVKWLKGTNGTYVALSDGGNISGSQTSGLSVNPVTFADSADYVAVAYDGSQYVTSSIAHLYVYSTNIDISQPGDPVVGFGDTTGTRYGGSVAPANVFDDTFAEWENGGSGDSAGAGFPPFGGPVGIIITPAVGSTVLAGMRFYPGQDATPSDPNGFILEGSNNGGTSYTTIASGALNLPSARNSIALPVDPTQASVQEVLFSNTQGYTSYRLTFPDVRDKNTASYLEIGDVEFLGVPGVGVAQPTISGTTLSGGNLNIAGSGGTPNGTFSVVTNGDLTVPVTSWNQATTGTFDGSGNFSISLPVSTSNPQLFYLIKTP